MSLPFIAILPTFDDAGNEDTVGITRDPVTKTEPVN